MCQVSSMTSQEGGGSQGTKTGDRNRTQRQGVQGGGWEERKQPPRNVGARRVGAGSKRLCGTCPTQRRLTAGLCPPGQADKQTRLSVSESPEVQRLVLGATGVTGAGHSLCWIRSRAETSSRGWSGGNQPWKVGPKTNMDSPQTEGALGQLASKVAGVLHSASPGLPLSYS